MIDLTAAAKIIPLTALMFAASGALAQQGPPGCNWKKYLYAQDAVQQGKIDTNLLNQMSAMASAQGYSLTNKVLQTCNGWLMEARRADGSPTILLGDPKTQTIVDADFRWSRLNISGRTLTMRKYRISTRIWFGPAIYGRYDQSRQR